MMWYYKNQSISFIKIMTDDDLVMQEKLELDMVLALILAERCNWIR